VLDGNEFPDLVFSGESVITLNINNKRVKAFFICYEKVKVLSPESTPGLSYGQDTS